MGSRVLRSLRRHQVAICGIVAVMAAVVVSINRPALLVRLDYRVYDGLTGWTPPPPPSGRIVIVDVDERSLAAIGQWPWRRDIVGRLVARIRGAGASVVALDMMFPEPDRSGQSIEAGDPAEPASLLRLREGEPATADEALADVLRQGRVVIGYAFTFDEPARQQRGCVLHPLGVAVAQPEGDGSGPQLAQASDAICGLPQLAQAAGASGFLNAAPDIDGVLRRVPLLIKFNDRIYPSLMLSAVMATTNTRAATLRVGATTNSALILGREEVPLDERGNLLLNYRGRNVFPRISAAEVLDGRVASDRFANKLVVIGPTALGTSDDVTTPLDTLLSGVEVQATAADNLFQQDFMSRPQLAPAIESLVTLALGMAIVLVMAEVGVVLGAGIGLVAVLALWLGAEWVLVAKRAFLSPLLPTIGTAFAVGVTIVASIARERLRADRAIQQGAMNQDLMIQSLLALAEIRHGDTGRHSRRTQAYARLLVEQLTPHPRFRAYLTPERAQLIVTLAPLHDIGKVGIPDQLLNKPSQLTPAEMQEMQKHPVYGREVILNAERQAGVTRHDLLEIAKEIVYTHHEWWDGHGYPGGLKGEQIPIAGRVVTVVDVYDALTSARAYREAMAHETAVGLIHSGRGTHFDPDVVDAFMRIAPSFNDVSVEKPAADDHAQSA